MGVRVRLREVSASGRLKMYSLVEKLPGPQFGVRVREVSSYGRWEVSVSRGSTVVE